MNTKTKLIVISIFCVLFACRHSRPKSKLISIHETKKLLTHCENCVVFEVCKEKEYKIGHLKSAYNIWRSAYEAETNKLKGFRVNKKKMEALLQKHGVNDESRLILYDCKGNVDAARFAWQLELFGFENYQLINGAKESLTLNNFEMTTEIPELPNSSNFAFKQNSENTKLLATVKDIKEAIKYKSVHLVDTRSSEEFKGLPIAKNGKVHPFKPGAYINGTIKGAINYDWGNAVLLDSNHQFKGIESLKYDFEKMGIAKDDEIIVFCQSGARSAHTSFVLRHLLGYDKVKNYDGSWIEWSYLNLDDYDEYPIYQSASNEEIEEYVIMLQETFIQK